MTAAIEFDGNDGRAAAGSRAVGNCSFEIRGEQLEVGPVIRQPMLPDAPLE